MNDEYDVMNINAHVGATLAVALAKADVELKVKSYV
jgi:hypothetical protein